MAALTTQVAALTTGQLSNLSSTNLAPDLGTVRRADDRQVGAIDHGTDRRDGDEADLVAIGSSGLRTWNSAGVALSTDEIVA